MGGWVGEWWWVVVGEWVVGEWVGEWWWLVGEWW